MVDYARVEHLIDRGRGRAAHKLGQPFTAYRLETTSSGDFPNGWSTVCEWFPLYRRVLPPGKLEISSKGVDIFYEIIADMEPFLIGDIFLQNDPPYEPGVSYGAGATFQPGTAEFNGMCFASHFPVGKNVGTRLNRRVSVYRPAGRPLLNESDNSLYWASTHDNDQPLLLASGQFSLGAPGSGEAVLVPSQIAMWTRTGDATFGPNVPGTIRPVKYFCYLPPLPGYLAREGDAIIDENGTRYVVLSLLEQQSGVVGQYCIVDRKIAQAG